MLRPQMQVLPGRENNPQQAAVPSSGERRGQNTTSARSEGAIFIVSNGERNSSNQ